jgi:hypothetical protein
MSLATRNKKHYCGAPLPGEARERLSRAVVELGEPRALRMLGISRSTLGRLLGGLSVHAGTAALIWQRLPDLEDANHQAGGAGTPTGTVRP